MNGSIFVIEDDRSLAAMLEVILSSEGYTVEYASDGEVAFRRVIQSPPDMILLDISLPGIDGFEFIRRLRAEPKTMHVPIIVLTGKTDLTDKLRAFQLLVHDFVTKPFNSDELLARIQTHLHHSRAALLSPLTRLPGGLQIERATERRIACGQPWAFLYLDLDHFKALNDGYGFWRGNEMIRLLSSAIIEATQECGNPEDFVGHIGGEDFVVISTPDHVHPLCQAITQRFIDASRRFYQPEDLERGSFMAVGREGPQQLYPLVTISIAVITSETWAGPVTLADISVRSAAVKARSKAAPGNCYIIDGDATRYTVDQPHI